MTQLPQPPKGFDPEWAAQNNRVIEGRLRGLSTLEQRFSTLSDTVAGDLTAIATLTGTGFLARTADDSWALRTLTGPAAGITVTNGAGIAGNPALALANDLAALEGLGSTGIAVRTGADAWAQRTITGTAAEITVTNGNGVSGNPTLSLPAALTFTGKTVTGGTFNSGAFNGTVGATTPSTGSFTTLSATGTVTGNSTGTTGTAFVAPVTVAANQYQEILFNASFSGKNGAAFRGGLDSGGNPYGALLHYVLGSESEVVRFANGSFAVTGTLSCTGNATLGTATADNFGVRMNGNGGTQFVAAGNVSGVPTVSAYTAGFALAATLQLQHHGGALNIGGSTAVTGTLSCTGNATLGDAGTDTVDVKGRIFGSNLHNNASGLSGASYIGSGTYTPTGAAQVNVTSVTVATAKYLRVGNVVTVSGTVDISATAATSFTRFSMTLPISSNLTALTDLAGAANFLSGSAYGAAIVYADTTNDRAFFDFNSIGAGTHNFTYSYTYEVK